MYLCYIYLNILFLNIYFKINNLLPMRKFYFIFLFTFIFQQSYSQCTYSICLEDTYGDGWNGNSIDVTVDGTLIYDDLTLSSGGGPECHSLTVNTGESISVIFNATGSWTSECEFYLYDSDGTLVASGDDSNNINETGSCPVPSDCTWQICLGDTYGDGWSGNSIDVIVNGVTQYDDLTLASGGGPECHNISVNYGEIIQVTADNSGSWSNECYFYFYDGNGDRIVYTFIDNAPVSYTVNASDCATERINGDCGKHNITVCGTEDINTSSVGHGNYWELSSSNDGCLGGENFSTWIYFHAQTAGQIGFSITPNNEDGGANDDDYDFAVWETTTCPPTTNPIRCSWAVAGDQSGYSGCSNRDIGYVTGIGTSNMLDAVDNSEDQCGDGWVDYINATAGQEFTMVIDNYSTTTNSFTLTWDLPDAATLDCTPLPVDYTYTKYDCSTNTLMWQILSETNNDYFIIDVGEYFDNDKFNF